MMPRYLEGTFMLFLVRNLIVITICVLLVGCATQPLGHGTRDSRTVRVMTFNILKGGVQLGQPVSQSAEVIRQARADIVILEERDESADEIAEALGYDWVPINSSVAILSAYPIEREGIFGARVAVPDGNPLYVFGVHLEAYPYGPYDLRDDPTLSEEALIRVAEETRGRQIAPVLRKISALLEGGQRVVLGGDFNEASHLDWTSRAAAAGRNFGRKVSWPTSRRVYAAGMFDSYRIVHDDEVAVPGLTWTPINESEFEVHDRIDLLYHGGTAIVPVTAEVVGARDDRADIVVTPYPTDHHGVVVGYRLGR